MATGAFFYTDSAIPNMNVEELRDHIETIDRRAYFDFLHCVHPDERHNKTNILNYLKEHEPGLYDCLESILKTYQSCHHIALEAREHSIISYHRYRVARDLIEAQGRDVVAEIIEVAEKEEAPKSKKKTLKRREPEEERQEIQQDKEITQKVARTLKHSDDDMFYAQEKFSVNFPFKDFVHYVKKGKTKWNLKEIDVYGNWETIYHVTGPWKAENLQQQLKREGKKAIIIKKTRGSMDQEVMSYKVLVGI
jgi:hypothetical protein